MTRTTPPHPESWIEIRSQGLYITPGDFYVDPVRPVERAVVTHGHADHARPGHQKVLATQATLDIMTVRYGDGAGRVHQPLEYGEVITIGEVSVSMMPAGHVLGSAQVVLEHKGARLVVSGDYKRRADPTCAGFEVVPCDVFVTEATFGLPVFRHPPVETEIDKLFQSVRLYPERCHVIGAYALGKAQRVISHIRATGYDRPIYIHGALANLCDLYTRHGVDLGELRPATVRGDDAMTRDDFRGEIVIAPPGAIQDRWSRRLPDPVVCLASGWMTVRQRAKQRGVELPLILSDHADWDELCQTFEDVDAPEIWVTHGREEAIVHHCRLTGRKARALALVGFEDEAE
ncbi:MAG: DNA ligase-associated DEXH box helicase [Alphaproteobacteria bacterium]|nr:DNA ligase-associated DEXH box helicase [Alphaproteobacteria bacterium]MAS46373.1 DNA ligase-associated DEXH box helicase [Alphaproteobacteria bacterium]MAX95443.1 DNA ligase-associated DEXH box helicase [Alphaproteobacteria bacterium]MBN54420.1 DNA ligase-associated DEXH box helicase [Alphaproteobacteria bacterium]OUT42024.1 MAG: DNA ligase-associated DEXH box helicase [Micavibrio sp. TMED2]|tara:strand:- start:5435 stop:6472 length:1038 start_codon:yes stop_codon:yes gene_type:complete